MGRAELEAAVQERLAALAAADFSERLWAADPTLWKADDDAHQKIVANALGWLSVFEGVRDEVQGLTEFVHELRAEGYRSAVLLGMGGSSLAPEVMRAILGTRPGYLDLHVLDSTDPAAVAAVAAAVDLESTLFVVASKSGGTTETACFHAYFYERLRELDGEPAGHHFVAITDEGTSLEQQALDQGFRAVFVNPGDIGGRYSALSFFGMVPAALIGVDLERLLDGVCAMAVACGPDVPAEQNPALRLGAALGELALRGRDKLTLVFEPPLAPLGAWVEQLVAESTGKEGTGILPVDLEELGPAGAYGDDRVFAAVRLKGAADARVAGALETLRDAGHPVLEHEIADVRDLGGELLRWEIAVAAAGHVLGIDAFDQPNVQESKDITKGLLGEYAATGELPAEPPADDGRRVAYAVGDEDLPAALREFLAQAAAGDYVALQAYVAPGQAVWDRLQAVRLQLRDGLRVATTLGYGPRYLHSTGQMHKGGPNTGLFLQLLGHDPDDVEIPGQPYSFGTLKRAQARGDLTALRAHGCRAIRVCLGDDVPAGVARLAELIATV
ncbi:MAG: glucose-6-phosphate isomerase [Actinobacteria bacterium]|nr:glucose-6-phosphate isomerase [Actinomycetota bacterium]